MAKKLLITGGCGFIGAHLVEGVLKQTDWEIVVLDSLTYAGNLNRLLGISTWDQDKHRVKFVWHDLKSPISDTTHKMIGEMDYIWHLAAESHVGRSLEDSIPFITSNVLGTAHLLEYVKDKQPNLKKFNYFSTDEVFGPAPEGYFFKEGDACNPSNPYSASKEGGEAISKAFAFCYKVPVVLTRTMNVFGEKQHPEKFVPKTIKEIMSGEVIQIHWIPPVISSRCWVHAREVCNVLIFLMENGEVIDKEHQFDRQHGVYHIVGAEKDVLYLANRMSKVIKGRELNESEMKFVDFHSTRPGHDLRYALAEEKLKSAGFVYKMGFDESFETMVRWMIDKKNVEWLNL